MKNKPVQKFFATLVNDETLVRIDQYTIVEVNSLWAIFREDRNVRNHPNPLDVYFQTQQEAIDYAVNLVSLK